MAQPKKSETTAHDRRLQPRGVPAQTAASDHPARQPSATAYALTLTKHVPHLSGGAAMVIVTSENRAEETGAALRCFSPGAEVLVLPPWDCLAYDRASPSRECMGRRMAVLRRLAEPFEGKRVLIASLEAALQRLPPRQVAAETLLDLRVGERFDRSGLERFAQRAGFLIDDRVDEPGEIALFGEVADIFPPEGLLPVRLMLEDDRIAEIWTYDPLSQRTIESLDSLRLGSASEVVLPEEKADERTTGMEHRLASYYPALETIFDAMPDAEVILSPQAKARAQTVLQQVEEAYAALREFGSGAVDAIPPESLHLTQDEWRSMTKSAHILEADEKTAAVPRFATERSPRRALADFVQSELAGRRRVVVTGNNEEREQVARMLKRHMKQQPQVVQDWQEIVKAPEGSFLAAPFDLGTGITDPETGVALVTAHDVFGSRLTERTASARPELFAELELRVGDVVVHEDHGVGILRALERVEVDGIGQDTVRLEYHGGASLLVPVEEFGKLWRYGADADSVSLDRLNTDSWQKKRSEVSAEIDEAAAGLVALAEKRLSARTEPLRPPSAAYERLAARFPFPETADQSAAIEAVLDDLASGQPANRLVCGDVGFGKTEIALRAAAAVALAGKQVALIAPTTVLVRQHLDSFRRRFAETEIEVAQLSRLIPASEAKRVKEGVKDGSIRIVLGTQAIAAKDVQFADLGLVIVDEEQRFGAKLKQQLRELRDNVHFVTLSATPIPRTMQAVLAGLQDVSILATPPARRRPVRTFLAPFDGATVRIALLREKRRSGQSFLVVPRIEDIEPMAAKLSRLVPELKVLVAHGQLPAEEVDETMVAFARGEADVLLATNIIESGLDVPRANTILIWRADRFGLSQLHQLRGRVGRGRLQAVAYLLTDPEEEIATSTRARLSTLEAYDRLGSGLEISMRDLDLRGGGDLLGEAQAGHAKLIGAGLYQQLMARALRAAKGEELRERPEPHLNLEIRGFIPESYVHEPTVRIDLYSRLQRFTELDELEAFAEEIEDRFGEIPRDVHYLLELRRIGLMARRLEIAKIDGGPVAIAVSFFRQPGPALLARWGAIKGAVWKGERLVVSTPSEADEERLELVETLLKRMGRKTAAKKAS